MEKDITWTDDLVITYGRMYPNVSNADTIQQFKEDIKNLKLINDMTIPKFSIVVIVKNEEKVLPRLLGSLKEFRKRGGDICILDTGSTDNTRSIYDMHYSVDEFLIHIDHKIIKDVNAKFKVGDEKDILEKGDTYFDFSQARNHAAHLAINDIVFFYDADEVALKLDIDYINQCIDMGNTQFEYNFVFAYDAYGNEAVKFVQSKAYDRREQEWQGIIHELIVPFKNCTPQRMFLDENVYKLGHYQNQETGRHSYLKGLSVDCYLHPDADRQSHYFARELMWSGRPNSALKEFKRHIAMNRWPAEKAQSQIFVGDCYGMINLPVPQLRYYHDAFYTDSTRREALLRVASYYFFYKNYQAAICFAKAAIEIPFSPFYANDMADYTTKPHDLLYNSYGFVGNIEAAKEQLLICLDYEPLNPKHLFATRFYFEYFDQGIEGWMSFKELLWLYNTGKEYESIVEIGSWKGRSTHAILSGQKLTKLGPKPILYCVDTWLGSDDVRDDTNRLAKQEDIFETFKKNIAGLPEPLILRHTSVMAAIGFTDREVDVVFIDAGHRKEDVLQDINSWLPKVDKLICGHDYKPDVWMGVVEAVNEIFGKPDGVVDTIWYVDVEKYRAKRVTDSLISDFPFNSTPGLADLFFKSPKPNVKQPVHFIDDTVHRETGKSFDDLKVSGFLVPTGPEGCEVSYDSTAGYDMNSREARIPKVIYTIWLSESLVVPELVQKCIASHKIKGYAHSVITLDSICDSDFNIVPWLELTLPESTYLTTALRAKAWAKASDFLRMWILIKNGGIYLDADVEVMEGQNFDRFLNDRMFAGQEDNGFIGTAVIGAEPGYPFITKWMNEVLTNFRGDDGKNIESSVELLTRGYWELGYYKDPVDGFKVYPREVFYPWGNYTKTLNITPETVTHHHFMMSWLPPTPTDPINKVSVEIDDRYSKLIMGSISDTTVFDSKRILIRNRSGLIVKGVNDKMPWVSIIIPHIYGTRKEGLIKCVESINNLHYAGVITIHIVLGPDTVPEKIDRCLKTCTGDYICFLADDTEIYPDALKIAVDFSISTKKGLVSFNTGSLLEDRGNICTHFIIEKSVIGVLENDQIFSTEFHHVGCDNWLWAQLLRRGEAIWCEAAIVKHKHFSNSNGDMDEVYQKGWDHVNEDRNLLRKKLDLLDLYYPA